VAIVQPSAHVWEIDPLIWRAFRSD